MKGKKLFKTLLLLATLLISSCTSTTTSSSTAPSSSSASESSEVTSSSSTSSPSTLPSSSESRSSSSSSSEQKAPVSLSVTPPNKLVYVEGDAFDATGMSVYLVYNDGSTELVASNKYEISGFSSSIVGKCTVTVSYLGFSASFEVTINKKVTEVSVDEVVFESKTVTYNAQTHEITVSNLPEHVNVTYSNNSLKNAGELEATAKLEAEDGYCITAGGSEVDYKILTAKLTVEAKEITASVGNLQYTGEVLVPSVSFSGVISGESLDSTVTYSPELIKEPGEYTATISISNSNYRLASTSVKFNVLLETTQLEMPTFVINNAQILINLVDENSDTWAYSFDGVNFISTTAASVDVKCVGKVTVYVKALPNEGDILHISSEVNSKEVFIEGNIASYEFDAIDDNKNIEDLTGLGGTLTAFGKATALNSRITLDNSDNDTYLISNDLLNYMDTSSICIEAVAKVEGVEVPAAGGRFYTILNKTDEYFIGYWVDANIPNKARLCMVLQSGVEGEPYYGRYYDDTNIWFSLDSVNDGIFHDYAITYDSETGLVSYYMDKILIGSAQRVAKEVARYTGNSLVFGANGNKYDAEHGSLTDFGNITYDSVLVKNFVPSSLSDNFDKTSAVISGGKQLTYLPTDNKSNLVYLDDVDSMTNYGSMTFEMSFAINPDDFTPGVRYTLANRDLNFQMYLIKDNGKFYGQCYIKTTGTTTYGVDFLDFGDISQIADGTIHTMGFSFNALTGKAYARIDDIHYDWMEKEFGGTLVNPCYSLGVAMPLYIGSAAWGEALPESTAIVSYSLTNNPYDVLKQDWGDKTLTPIDVSGIVFDDLTVTYDGTEHELPITNVPNKVNVELSDNKLTNAGKKIVTAKLTPFAGYKLVYKGQEFAESLILEADLTVKPKEITATIASIPYSGEVETPVISFVGLVEPTVEYSVTYDPEEIKDVGEYTATITLENDNYVLTDDVINFSVGASPIAVDAITFSDLEVAYDGTEHSIVCANLPEHVSVVYENAKSTNVADLTAKATIVPDPGYYLTNGGVKLTEAYVLTASLKVTPKQLTASIANLTYTGEELTPVISLAGVVEGDVVNASGTYDRTVKNPGIYYSSVTLDNINYCLASSEVVFLVRSGASYSGTVNDFTFNEVSEARTVEDEAGSGTTLYFDDVAYDTDNGALHVAEGAVLRSLDGMAYDECSSITVEVTTKVNGVYVPSTGDKWFPIVCKDNEFFIGFWTVSTTPDMARLCMIVHSGVDGESYYGVFFDDTNLWLPLSQINDGAFHTYSLSYDSLTGVTRYYRDYLEIDKLPTAPVRVAGESRRLDGTTTLYVGAGWGANTEITIDNLRISGKALGVTEMKEKGTIVHYDFSAIENECVVDISGNNHPLYVGPEATAVGGVVNIPTNVNANVANSDAFITQSFTIEVVTKVSGIFVPEVGEKWFPIAQKDNQFFLAYWTTSAEPDKARLVMIIQSGVPGEPYYEVYYDDTNLWLPLSQVNDGNFHHYAMTYDAASAVTHYYYDYCEVGKLPTAPLRVPGEVIRQATNVMFVGAGWGANTALAIDELRVNGRALLPSQFVKKSKAMSDIDFSTLVDHTILDASGNKNNIVISGDGATATEGGVSIPATVLASIPASSSLASTGIDIEVTCIVNGISFPETGDKWYPILCKDNEYFLGYWVAAGGVEAHLCMVIQSGLPGSTEYSVYFDDIICWKNLDWINGVEHTYRMTFDPIDGVTHYYVDGIEQAKFVDAPVRVPGQVRRIDTSTPIWIAAGWGFNTDVIFKSLTIKD